MNRLEIQNQFATAFVRGQAIPSSPAALADVEKKLNTLLPKSFHLFATRFGAIHTPDILALVTAGTPEEAPERSRYDVQEFFSANDILKTTQAYRSGGIDHSLIIIASDCMGNVFGFPTLTGTERPDEAAVYLFDHTSDKLLEQAPSFDSWLQTFLDVQNQASSCCHHHHSKNPIVIRPEIDTDISRIHAMVEQAFGQSLESDLVDNLRTAGKLVISLVAEQDGELLGHIAFSAISATPKVKDCRILGLAPVSVLPDRQRHGIGSTLIRAGFDHAREQKYTHVVVLGDPNYYCRFGFQPAHHYHIKNDYTSGDEFMITALSGNEMPSHVLLQYESEFFGV